jgi:hypothetical protein
VKHQISFGFSFDLPYIEGEFRHVRCFCWCESRQAKKEKEESRQPEVMTSICFHFERRAATCRTNKSEPKSAKVAQFRFMAREREREREKNLNRVNRLEQTETNPEKSNQSICFDFRQPEVTRKVD